MRNFADGYKMASAELKSSGLFIINYIMPLSNLNSGSAEMRASLSFDPSRVVPTGPENSVRTASDNVWRRVA